MAQQTLYSRIAARRGQLVNLDATFHRGGVPTDPFAIRRVEIYRSQVVPHNLIRSIPVLDPWDRLYPTPLVDVAGVGKYSLRYSIPADAQVPDVYFDVWYYYPDNPCAAVSTGTGTDFTVGGPNRCDLNSAAAQKYLLSCCHRFWVYPDNWSCGDNLHTLRFAFEPLDQKFRKPEVRPLEVGIMPLPLYDYDYNLNMPIIPFLTATIRVETQHREVFVNDEPMTIGLRQGAYRSNPFVLRWNLDTSRFLIGTYRYRITIKLPDGTTRASDYFILTVS